ncbi:MAG: hypothetical protein V7774_07850 [Pseudorhizobium pelagicum]|uniref:hypothetical protein n=1 Tax=Pseudorhizobium pelagicum TaxID=1509405 RepID=UPI003460CF1F
MWFDLSNAEIDLIIDALGEGSLADKLRERPHPHTGAFTRAAEEKADGDKLFIEETGIILRYAFGAYVMAWMWVGDEEADVPTSLDGFAVSDELQSLLQSLPSFRIIELNVSDTAISGHGKTNDYEWILQTVGQVFVVTASSKTGKAADWLHIEEFELDTPARRMSYVAALWSVGRALQNFSTTALFTLEEHHPLLWRKNLELFALGAISAKEAVNWLGVPVDVLEIKARPLREHISELRRNGLPVVLAGPGIPRIDRDRERAAA